MSSGLTHPNFKKHKSRTAPNVLPFGHAARNLVYCVYRGNARARGHEFALSMDQFIELTAANCYYCGLPPSSVKVNKELNGHFVYSGIDRLDNTKGYFVGNVVACCKRCNYAKNAMTLEEFTDWIYRIVRQQISAGNLCLDEEEAAKALDNANCANQARH